MRLIGSTQGVADWWRREDEARPRRSKGIYITDFHQLPGYHGWERLRIWTEGIAQQDVEVLLDGELVTTCEAPPYMLGTEEYSQMAHPGEHLLQIRGGRRGGWSRVHHQERIAWGCRLCAARPGTDQPSAGRTGRAGCGSAISAKKTCYIVEVRRSPGHY